MSNQLTAGNILSLFATTKDERQSFAEAAIQDLENGTRSAVEMHLQLKCMADIIDRITGDKNFRDYLVIEATNRGKSFEVHNAKFSLREMGGKWDYSQTQDQVLFDLEAKQETIKAQIAERQKMLKLIPAGGMADPETGNIIFKAAAPATTTTVVVTLK
jgi:hypothetical protein